LIRLLSDQMLKRKRLGKDIFMRGIKGNVKSIFNSEYSVSLFDIMKTYANIIMTKDFHRINIPRLPVFTTEDGINQIKKYFGKLNDWKNLDDLIPENYLKKKNLKKTGKAGIFAGSLELVKEGNVRIKQEKLFEKILIKDCK